jgi:hypothetical protein
MKKARCAGDDDDFVGNGIHFITPVIAWMDKGCAPIKRLLRSKG